MSDHKVKKVRAKRKRSVGDAKQIAEPAREALRNLLKGILKTQSSRIFVAESLGKSVRTINSLIYEGKGGFDLMLAALIVIHKLREEDITAFFKSINNYPKTQNILSESDRRWAALDDLMSESEKIKWTLVMDTYARLS
ncbi:MAG: hypothetical protein EOP07_00465 [Proteobacteria bacterium]|nr:MAG: hypothetical protein EOP07_00465 [Pseudomonadota bacterium]